MNRTKGQNKWIYLRFAGIILVGALIGGIYGYYMSMGAVDLVDMGETLNEALSSLGLWWFAPGFILLLISSVACGMGRKLLPRIEEDQVFDRADRLATVSMTCAGAASPWMILAIALSFAGISTGHITELLWTVGLLVVYCVWLCAVQALAVGLIKGMRPEKRGNVFDTRFQTVWYQSCDEAERQQIGQSSYCALRMMNRVFPVVMVVLCLLALFQMAPPAWILLVGGLWLVQQVTYLYACCVTDPLRMRGKGERGCPKN